MVGDGDQAPPSSREVPTCLAGRYRLQGLVGSGGMGTVYRAHDELLDEVVAVKVLSRVYETAAADRRRFLREVKLARRVTHPNVVRTYDVGEHDGLCFLTMELVAGASLANVARDEGRQSAARAASIGSHIASGLAASHAAGVVHADLKPDNVICAADGRVVITDFGVARAMRWALAKESEGSDELPMGTLPYMAPEQISGARDIDGRADIYALGCILYRLATGRRAWPKGCSPLERLVGPPDDPRRVAPDVDPTLAATILRCLAPDPSDRFQLAKDVFVALETLASGNAASGVSVGRRSARKKAVAVLPLENHGSPNDAYLAFGLAERVCEYLAGNVDLRVRSFGASCAEALRSADVRSIGRALGVDAVVHGVLAEGTRGVHLGLGLLSVSDGSQIGVFQIESARAGASSAIDELALELESALLVAPAAAPRRRLEHRVEEAFQRGRYILATQYYATEAALPYLREAFEGAPTDPSVAATFALCVLRDARLGEWSPARIEHARDAIRRAYELHPDAPELAAVLGALLLEGGFYREAATSFCQARAMGPDNPLVLDWSGRMVLEAGDPDAAIEYLLKAHDADPAQASLEVALARASYFVGDVDEALTLCRRRANSDAYSTLHVTVLARLARGRWTAALRRGSCGVSNRFGRHEGRGPTRGREA